MKKQKPSLPKGTRDFAPEVMVKRNLILDTIKSTFKKFGFLPLETPSMERLDVLTGKYGDEGDQLIFKILNSGDFLKDIHTEHLEEGYKKMTPKIAEKALRYDLTVPFARFVAMNRGVISFPFKRYQIQPVWRGDRPQKGRYREFYQCDADVVGTNSLICEAEIVYMMNEVFDHLGIKDFTIKINNRKILSGIAEMIGEADRLVDLCVAIDKLDKIGEEKVMDELLERGFSNDAVQKLYPIFKIDGDLQNKVDFLKEEFGDVPIGQKGLEELETVLNYLDSFAGGEKGTWQKLHLEFDITLARGLNYYTGAIFEVKAHHVSIGSISGGGRYDDLTSAFGLPDMSGIGFSFGVDRIYDVMEELGLFPQGISTTTQVMFTNFDQASELYSLPILRTFREAGFNCEVYPDSSKLKKQLNYANAKGIPFVILLGSEEMQTGQLTLKNMQTGEQDKQSIEEILAKLKAWQA